MSKHENNAATVRITFNANDLLPTDAQINDLDLTDEELDSIKGGPNPGGADDGGGGGRTGGDWIINHNEMTLSDAHDLLPAEAQVTDLDLTDEELDSIKGGPNLAGSEDGGGGRTGGDWIINHNEMTLRDAHDLLPAEAQVTDLDLTDEELDSIKGGPNPGGADDGGGGRSGGDWIMNNNEMMLRDE